MTRQRPRVLLSLVLAIGAVAFGCAGSHKSSGQVEPARQTEPDPESKANPYSGIETWRGEPVTLVITQWGRPASIKPDGEGGSILTYAKISVEPTGTVITDPTGPPEPRGPHQATVQGEPHVEQIKQAVFWIDEAGVVYRYWFSPRAYRKGLTSPPKTVPLNQ